MSGLTILAQDAVGSGAAAFALFFALLIGHCLADFPLQGQFLAMGKNRHHRMPAPEGSPFPPHLWVYCLSSHSIIHAAPVWLITGSVTLAAIEVVLHWLIDFAKNEGWTNFGVDQGLHVACKLAYTVCIWKGFVS